MTTNDQVADVLERAADLYESEAIEWCKRDWVRRDGDDKVMSACAEGAIYLAAGLPALLTEYVGAGDFNAGDHHEAYRLGESAIACLASSIDPEKTRLYYWNDREATSKTEVIEAMKACAKGLRNGE
jgi:hypothetical protein